MEDFILPKKYTENVIDVSGNVDSKRYGPGVLYSFNLILTKELEKVSFFGKKKHTLKSETYTIAEYISSHYLHADSQKTLSQYKKLVSYVEAIRSYIKNKKRITNFDKLIEEGNEAIISSHSFVKDAFILKVVEELKKYNA